MWKLKVQQLCGYTARWVLTCLAGCWSKVPGRCLAGGGGSERHVAGHGDRGEGVCFFCLLSVPLTFRLPLCLLPPSPFLRAVSQFLLTFHPLPHLSVFPNTLCIASDSPWLFADGRPRGRVCHPVKMTLCYCDSDGDGDSDLSHMVLVGGQGWLQDVKSAAVLFQVT